MLVSMLQFVEFGERPAALAAMNVRGEEAKRILEDPLLYQKKAINLMTDGAADLMNPACFAYTESLIIRDDQLSKLAGAQLSKLKVLAVHIENVDMRERLARVFRNIENGLTNYWARVNFPALETLVIYHPSMEGNGPPFSLALDVFRRASDKLRELHVEGKGFAFGVDTADVRGLNDFFEAKRDDGKMYCDQIERLRATFFPEDLRFVTHMNGLKEYIAAGLWKESLPLIEKMPNLETFRILGRGIGPVLYPQRVLTRYPTKDFKVRVSQGMFDWRDREAIDRNPRWRQRVIFDRNCVEVHSEFYWTHVQTNDGWRSLDNGDRYQLVSAPDRIVTQDETVERQSRFIRETGMRW